MPKNKVSATKSLWQRVVEWGQELLEADEPAARPRRLPERDATIRRVRQVNLTSCGVAAAAMFARQDHETVKAFMFPKRRPHYGTHYEDVWGALEHFGVRHERRKRKFLSWEEIPSSALVCVRWRHYPSGKGWHWVVFQKLKRGFRVIDPASDADTLAMIDLDTVEGFDYSLVTPRTREEGPLHAPLEARPRVRSAAKSASKSRRREVKK